MCPYARSGPSPAINTGSVWQATAAARKKTRHIGAHRHGIAHGLLSGIAVPLRSEHPSGH